MENNRVLFFENYTAAVSMKNFWTRMASTIGCIKIKLTPSRLTVKPHWYAKWLIIPLRLDLCHDIPVSSIRSIRATGTWFSYGMVEVKFGSREGQEQKILLYLKKYREFVHRAAGLRP